jgi:hypothetical protein
MTFSYPEVMDYMSLDLNRSSLFTVYLPLFSKKISPPGQVAVCPGFRDNLDTSDFTCCFAHLCREVQQP